MSVKLTIFRSVAHHSHIQDQSKKLLDMIKLQITQRLIKMNQK